MMPHPSDEIIQTVVNQLNTGFGKGESVPIQQFMGMQGVLGFLAGKPVPIEQVTLCGVPCKTVHYTVQFYDKTATIVGMDTPVYPNVS